MREDDGSGGCGERVLKRTLWEIIKDGGCEKGECEEEGWLKGVELRQSEKKSSVS